MKRKKTKTDRTDRPKKKFRAVIGRPSERANVKRFSLFGEQQEPQIFGTSPRNKTNN